MFQITDKQTDVRNRYSPEDWSAAAESRVSSSGGHSSHENNPSG